jgi:hypothetical protein
MPLLEPVDFLAWMTPMGDVSPPTSMEDALGAADAAVLGTVVGVADGRRQFLDPQNSGAGLAAHVVMEVEPDEWLFGELGGRAGPVFVEAPWPTNLSIGALRDIAPIGSRVVVLAEDVTADAAMLSAPAIDAGLSDPVEGTLVVAPPWGLIVERDADGVPFPMQRYRPIVLAAAADGIEVASFDDIVDLIRR